MLRVGDKYFHTQCFKCSECKTSLSTGNNSSDWKLNAWKMMNGCLNCETNICWHYDKQAINFAADFFENLALLKFCIDWLIVWVYLLQLHNSKYQIQYSVFYISAASHLPLSNRCVSTSTMSACWFIIPVRHCDHNLVPSVKSLLSFYVWISALPALIMTQNSFQFD